MDELHPQGPGEGEGDAVASPVPARRGGELRCGGGVAVVEVARVSKALVNPAGVLAPEPGSD